MPRTPLPTLDAILERPQSVPLDVGNWIRTYHRGEPYSSRPLGVRDPEISRFLTYYAIYAKLFLPPNRTSYKLPVTDPENPLTRAQLQRLLQNEGLLCGSGEYRPNGFLDDVGSAFETIGDAVVELGRGVIDYIESEFRSLIDDPIGYLSSEMEEYLLDGRAARHLGVALSVMGCGPPCAAAGEKIATAQNVLNRANYFGQKPDDFVNLEYFWRGDKSRPKPPDVRNYKFYCWRLPGNFTYGLATATPFERTELQLLTSTSSFLAPFFQEVIARDNVRAPLDVATAFAVRQHLNASKTIGSFELMRLYWALRSLVRAGSPGQFRHTSASGIPFTVIPELDIVVEKPQVEALLLILRQQRAALTMYANITEDTRLETLARENDPSFATSRLAFLHLGQRLSVNAGALSERDRSDLRKVDASRFSLPTLVLGATGLGVALVYGAAKYFKKI